MRKLRIIAVMLAAGLLTSCASTAEPGNRPALRVLAYPVNRALDLLDIFSLSVGTYTWWPAGEPEADWRYGRWFLPGVAGEVHITRALELGVVNTWGAEAGWWPKRELGVGTKRTVRVGVVFVSGGETSYNRWGTRGTRHVEYGAFEAHTNSPSDPIFQEHLDYWGIGASIGLLAGVEFELHPVEVADLVCGLLFIDFMWDDIGHRR